MTRWKRLMVSISRRRAEKRIYRSHKRLFDHAEDLRSYSKALIDTCALPQRADDPMDALLIFLVARAHTTFGAALQLIRSGLAIDAVMQMRNLVEGLITLRFLLDDPEPPARAERYIAFDAVIRNKALFRVDQLSDDAFEEVRARFQNYRDEIRSSYEEFREKYRDDFSSRYWAGTENSNLEKLASATSSDELYSAFYGSYSQIVHGSVESSRYYIEMPAGVDGPVTIKVGPSMTRIEENLTALVSMFPLYWDEVSMKTGTPARDELTERVSSGWFEHFSRSRNVVNEDV